MNDGSKGIILVQWPTFIKSKNRGAKERLYLWPSRSRILVHLWSVSRKS